MKKQNREIGTLVATRDGSGPASWGERFWHRENIKMYPISDSEFTDVENLIREFCLDGFGPEQPILRDDDNVVAIGSCFAAELRHFLGEVGLASDSFWIPSGLNNTFAINDFFQWAVNGQSGSSGYAYERDDRGFLTDWSPKLERETYRRAISEAGAFVFTLGLAEVWEDAVTGGVFWRGVPDHIFESERHRSRLSTVEENRENLSSIVNTIRNINSNAPIILTLSPVPLKATFSKYSCITADCISKSTLRLAIHEFICSLENEQKVHYWPSFEAIKWVGCHLPYPVYGTDDACTRHVSRFMVNAILRAFVHTYYGSSICENLFRKQPSSLEVREGEPGEPPLIYSGQIVKA